MLLLPCGLQAQDFIEWVENAFVPPTLVLNSLNQGSNYCTLVANATISDEGSHSTSERGFVISQTPEPTVDDLKFSDGAGAGTFQEYLTGSDYSNEYYVRAYSINNEIVTYSNELNITTSDKLTYTTSRVIGTTTADLRVSINENSNVITRQRIRWRKVNAGIYKTENASSFGTYTWYLTNLEPNTDYEYYTEIETEFSNELCQDISVYRTFTTDPDLPTITTKEPYNIQSTTAAGGGENISDGGLSITARGICWSESSSPTIDDNTSDHGGGTTAFLSAMTGLTPGTTYYVRAYATNSLGTGYGGVKSFTTESETVPCASQTNYPGGQAMPTVKVVTLGSGTGTVTLNFNAANIPDRFVVVFDGQIVIDTGYRGCIVYQSDLDTFFGESTPITVPGSGIATFFKNSSVTTATVKVYGPLPSTKWDFTLSCPQ